VLINNTAIDFIFSDNPVVLYNSFDRSKGKTNATGLQSHGLQLFCPLNKKVTILLYDHRCYSCVLKEGYVVEINESDVDSINSLQLYNAEKCVYFSDCNQGQYVKKLHDSFGTLKKGERKIETAFKSETRELLHFYKTGIEYNLDLSFLSVRKDVKIEGDVRRPDITKAVDEFVKDRLKEAKKRKK